MRVPFANIDALLVGRTLGAVNHGAGGDYEVGLAEEILDVVDAGETKSVACHGVEYGVARDGYIEVAE